MRSHTGKHLGWTLTNNSTGPEPPQPLEGGRAKSNQEATEMEYSRLKCCSACGEPMHADIGRIYDRESHSAVWCDCGNDTVGDRQKVLDDVAANYQKWNRD